MLHRSGCMSNEGGCDLFRDSQLRDFSGITHTARPRLNSMTLEYINSCISNLEQRQNVWLTRITRTSLKVQLVIHFIDRVYRTDLLEGCSVRRFYYLALATYPRWYWEIFYIFHQILRLSSGTSDEALHREEEERGLTVYVERNFCVYFTI